MNTPPPQYLLDQAEDILSDFDYLSIHVAVTALDDVSVFTGLPPTIKALKDRARKLVMDTVYDWPNSPTGYVRNEILNWKCVILERDPLAEDDMCEDDSHIVALSYVLAESDGSNFA